MISIEDTAEIKLYNCAAALGKFDGLHRGHQLLIDRIRKTKKNGLTSVLCMIDMGKDGILSHREQEKILEENGVDILVRFPFTREFAALSPEDFVKEILFDKFHVKEIVVGTDFCFGCNRSGTVATLNDLADRYQYQVSAIEKLSMDGDIVSSTRIRNALLKGEMETANRLLGRNYRLIGRVTHGRHLGSTIGFPTANIFPEEGKLLPRCGVYASKIYTKKGTYRAITNIGSNPTVDIGNPVTIESYLFDFSGNLYEQEISVEPLRFIRQEQRFESVDQLKNQLFHDISFVKDLKY